jgi:CRISPR-associated protein Csm4
MQTYRVTFHLASPGLTPWQADTLFGHLCWALARLDGEEAVRGLLARCRAGDPPLLLSDGFPPDAFPPPLLPPPAPKAPSLREQRTQARREKAAQERRWLTAEQFTRALQGAPPEMAGESAPDAAAEERPFRALHSQTDRRTGATTGLRGAGEGPFAVEGVWTPARVFYLRTADRIGFDWRALLEEVARTGFGRRKSAGYGAISAVHIEPFAGFGEPADATGFVSLSTFVPARGDPIDGWWRTEVKYGKLGEERASTANPFKRPLVRLQAGAVFRTGGMPRLFYGRMVEGIAPQMPDVMQYGFAFAVPMRIDGVRE